MKEYCVSLELAKELKENGFLQKSFNSWVKSYDVGKELKGIIPDCGSFYWFDKEQMIDRYEIERYSAPTSDEILKKLPSFIFNNDGDNCYLTISKDYYTDKFKAVYVINYNSVSGFTPVKEMEEEKLSNALAKMWLYLKKEGYIK